MDKYVCGICGYVYDPEVGIRITELSRAQHGKMFLKIGYALCAE